MATKPLTFNKDEHQALLVALDIALGTFERRASDPKTPGSVRSLWYSEVEKLKALQIKIGPNTND